MQSILNVNVNLQILQGKFLLPKVSKSVEDKICLVVDLDETLVHSTFKVRMITHGFLYTPCNLATIRLFLLLFFLAIITIIEASLLEILWNDVL